MALPPRHRSVDSNPSAPSHVQVTPLPPTPPTTHALPCRLRHVHARGAIGTALRQHAGVCLMEEVGTRRVLTKPHMMVVDVEVEVVRSPSPSSFKHKGVTEAPLHETSKWVFTKPALPDGGFVGTCRHERSDMLHHADAVSFAGAQVAPSRPRCGPPRRSRSRTRPVPRARRPPPRRRVSRRRSGSAGHGHPRPQQPQQPLHPPRSGRRSYSAQPWQRRQI